MNDLEQSIKTRFPNAQFEIHCYKTLKQFLNDRVLVSEYEVLYTDEYLIDGVTYVDFYKIRKQSCNEFVLYSDVLDQLIIQGFHRREFPKMMDIRETYLQKKNKDSMRVFCSTWSE